MPGDDSLHLAGLATGDVIGRAIASAGLTSGLADSLEHFTPVSDVARRWGVVEEKLETLVTVLDLMVRHGLLERSEGPPSAYRSVSAPPRETLSERLGSMRTNLGQDAAYRRWLADGHSDVVWNAQRAFVGDRLDYLTRTGGRLAFDDAFSDVWHRNLTNSLYERGRTFCVRAIATRGGRYLDLASGLGYGTQRLVEFSGDGTVVDAMDKSADFVRRASRILYPSTTLVRHHHRDLNDGLPRIPRASVDGVLFMGAFHYISDKRRLLLQIYDALRPGGRVALGQCFVHSGFADDDANRFMFSLALDRSYIVTRSDLLELLDSTGFDVVGEQPRGSQLSVVAEKRAEPLVDA